MFTLLLIRPEWLILHCNLGYLHTLCCLFYSKRPNETYLGLTAKKKGAGDNDLSLNSVYCFLYSIDLIEVRLL
jgi:hypothetical protein